MKVIGEDELRHRFKKLKREKANIKCFDCGSGFPQWTSKSFGIFICMKCSSTHRSFGQHITQVKSIKIDN